MTVAADVFIAITCVCTYVKPFNHTIGSHPAGQWSACNWRGTSSSQGDGLLLIQRRLRFRRGGWGGTGAGQRVYIWHRGLESKVPCFFQITFHATHLCAFCIGGKKKQAVPACLSVSSSKVSNGETESVKTMIVHDVAESDTAITPSKDGTLLVRQVWEGHFVFS